MMMMMASPSSSLRRRQHAAGGWSPSSRGQSWRWRRRRRKVVGVERTPTSSKSSRGKMGTTTTSSRHPERVRSRKPRDAPRDPHAALRDLEILAIVDDDYDTKSGGGRLVDVHSLFDETCEKNCVILMRSFG